MKLCTHPHSLLYPRYLNGPSLSGSNSLMPAVLTANFSSAPTKCCSVICSTNDESLQACHLVKTAALMAPLMTHELSEEAEPLFSA